MAVKARFWLRRVLTTAAAVGVALVFGPWAVRAGPLMGDVNCDGNTNSIDAALVLQLDARLLTSLPCPQNADISGDGPINAIDAALILQYDAGLLSRPDGPPSNDDLYVEVTRVGVTSGAFFWVYFENLNAYWSVCDLTFHVDFTEERLDGSTVPRSTNQVDVGDLAPLEGIETRNATAPGVVSVLDYWVVADWQWC